MALLRYFYEDLPDLYVVAAGSLLETMISRHISFPVGRVEYIALRPCSFGEFLNALGEFSLREALQDVYETLLNGYRDDIEKYASNDTIKNGRICRKTGCPFLEQSGVG